ncbi:MAG TPA: arginine deiminase family protein [Elusimicrobiota bacterium]|nr:arginine deiminase family protein [Elusimicrobiota bacterium]
MRASESAAYQGRGWKPRKESLAAELAADRGVWSPWRVDSEHRPLKAVLLHRPGAELRSARAPNAVQHLARIEPAALGREVAALAAAYRRLGVEVHWIPRAFAGGPWPPKFNLVFAADLFFATREGAMVSRMASEVRAGEEKHAARALAELAIPINRTISGKGLFEGADALWLDPKTVLCGVGNRTNAEGFAQLRSALKGQGVETIPARLPRGVQHLMGLVRLVDARLALVRAELAPKALLRLLGRRRIAAVPVPEIGETTEGQGMNVVVVAPRRIVMPKDCPVLKRAYAAAGIAVAAEVAIPQLRRGAGGIGCATGVLARRA